MPKNSLISLLPYLNLKNKLDLAQAADVVEIKKAQKRAEWHDNLPLFASQCFPDHTTIETPAYHNLTYLTIQSIIDKADASYNKCYVNNSKDLGLSPSEDSNSQTSYNTAKSVGGGYPPGSNKDTTPPPKSPQKSDQSIASDVQGADPSPPSGGTPGRAEKLATDAGGGAEGGGKGAGPRIIRDLTGDFKNLHSYYDFDERCGDRCDGGGRDQDTQWKRRCANGWHVADEVMARMRLAEDGVSVDFGAYPHLALVKPRGFGKSTMMMVTVIWALLTGRKKFVVYNSNSHEKAVELIKPIKYELEHNKVLKLIYGDQMSDKWAAGEFELANRSKVLARGRGQSVRGLKFISHRPDLVILDDIEDDEEVESRDQRMATQLWLDKQVLKGVSAGDGSIIIVGTVLHPDSLIANIATKKETDPKYARFLPVQWKALDARTPTESYPDGTSIWESKYPTIDLYDERKTDPYSFAQERMNEPIPLEAGTFKREYFQYFTEDANILKAGDKIVDIRTCNLYLTCDVAITAREYSDYTVLLITAVSPDNDWFILEYVRERWADPQQIIDEFFRLNSKYAIKLNGIETVAAQKWLYVNIQKQMKERNQFLAIQELKADRDKARRISSLQPRFQNGAVYIRNNMATLEEELLLFPKSPHDDISDALAYVPQLAATPKKQAFKPSTEGTFNWWRKKAMDAKKNRDRLNKRGKLRHLINFQGTSIR